MIETIAFDADDTLWHNEHLFTLTQERFAEMLAPYHERRWVDQRLYETEVRNLQHFGYGVKGFALSMIETAVELTEGRINGAEIGRLIELAKEMIAAPVALLPHVAETVGRLAQAGYRLIVITKGDLFDQESKLARSGLAGHFAAVEVVSEKDEATYQRLFERHGIVAEHLLMVGNSLKSDVLPVLNLGGWAVHVPYETTWAHERVDARPSGERFGELTHLGYLPQWLAQHSLVRQGVSGSL